MYKIPTKKARLRPSNKMSKQDYKAYQNYIMDIGVCQVCDISVDLDAPHHTKQGSHKDDKTLICICIECHKEIHTKGFSQLKKTRSQLEVIGEENWNSYICE